MHTQRWLFSGERWTLQSEKWLPEDLMTGKSMTAFVDPHVTNPVSSY